MIKGYIDIAGRPMVDIVVIGSEEEIPLSAIVDTGFDGDICLPARVAVRLGLKLDDIFPVELADGSIKEELIFVGKVKWGNQVKKADVLLTQSDDALVGTGLLKDSELKIGFLSRNLLIQKEEVK